MASELKALSHIDSVTCHCAPDYERSVGLLGSDVPPRNRVNAPKRRAACDECRKRKTKCSGELSGCSRCFEENIHCRYSVQKPMGRPPKKLRRLESGKKPARETTIDAASETFVTALTRTKDLHSSSATLVSDDPRSTDNDRVQESRIQPRLFQSAFWLPAQNLDSYTSSESDYSAQVSQDCACLASMYLTLSVLPKLLCPPLPQTFEVLYSAASTTEAIVRCNVCPSSLSRAMQNVYLVTTLLGAIGDGWRRVLEKMNSIQDPIISNPAGFFSSANEDSGDKKQLKSMVRQAIFGQQNPLTQGISQASSLVSIITESENRQHSWHERHTPASAMSLNTSDGQISQRSQPLRPDGYLCLRMIGGVKRILAVLEILLVDIYDLEVNGN